MNGRQVAAAIGLLQGLWRPVERILTSILTPLLPLFIITTHASAQTTVVGHTLLLCLVGNERGIIIQPPNKQQRAEMSDWEQRAEDAGGSKLNAGAKSFSFNPNARSFVPGGPSAPAPAPSTEGTYESSLTGGCWSIGCWPCGAGGAMASQCAARFTFL